jgi:hypothetical protein
MKKASLCEAFFISTPASTSSSPSLQSAMLRL